MTTTQQGKGLGVSESLTSGTHNLPAQLTTFVGRGPEMAEVRALLADHRLVTLTGTGGVGKTRLAVELAAQLGVEFDDGVWHVDLTAIDDPDLVPLVVMRALGMPDQPDRSVTDAIVRFIDNRKLLVVLDNCEHLLEGTAALVATGLRRCAALTVLATSREQIGVTGEVTWRVPSLSPAGDAAELFIERARRARPGFDVIDRSTVAEICRRLDGVPLAIELAAARVRSLTLAEIHEGLRDRFGLLTGGARAGVPRQQTLRASVDWSYALLTQGERAVLRRLAVFTGGCYLDGAEAVAADADLACDRILDHLSSLVDKSLVVAEDTGRRTRYRLLETVRQYAQDKLAESGETYDSRRRHRDHYAAAAAALDGVCVNHSDRVDELNVELDNVRAAFEWSRRSGDATSALTIASALLPLWLGFADFHEGRRWFDTALDCPAIPPALQARVQTDKTILNISVGVADTADADEAVSIARSSGDQDLLAWTTAGYAASHAYDITFGQQGFAEAITMARKRNNPWRLLVLLVLRAHVAYAAGEPKSAREAAEEGCTIADKLGDRYGSRACRWQRGLAQMMSGELAGAAAGFRQLRVEGKLTREAGWAVGSTVTLSRLLSYLGEVKEAMDLARDAIVMAPDLGGFMSGFAHTALAVAHLAAGDVEGATVASRVWREAALAQPQTSSMHIALMAQVAFARGDLVGARRLADDAVAVTRGWHHTVALAARTRIACAQGELEQADRDARDALACAGDVEAWLGVPGVLECLASLTADKRQAARLIGAAQGLRAQTGEVRFAIYKPAYDHLVADLREVLGDNDFHSEWRAGATLPIGVIVASAQRGRGVRKRPATGWESLTPTERDVALLVGQGLTNRGIAAQLFMSPRTVQTHLTHAYAKLGVASRVRLAQEAARHG
jgi:predicted ATPase/DNA-binding CsgD family transcriptional regulator